MTRWLRRAIGGAKALLRRRRGDSDLDTELRAFLEAAVAEKMRGGMRCEEAARAARLENGLVSMDSVKELVRDISSFVRLETLWQDLRLAVRLLAKDRAFTIAAVVALGLAIGLDTSVFAIIDAAFLRDVPLDEPTRLVAIQLREGPTPQPERDMRGPSQNGSIVAVSYADLRDWREQTTSFAGLAANGVREIAVAFEPIAADLQLGANRPFWVDISPNAILYVFVGLLSIASAFAFGLLPAWQMSKTDINQTLKAESRSGGGSVRGRQWASARDRTPHLNRPRQAVFGDASDGCHQQTRTAQ